MNRIFYLVALLIVSFATTGQIQTINVGTSPNDGTGDKLRPAMIKINSNFTYLNENGVVRLDSLIDAGVGGGGTWGSITGTLSSQTDLNTALGLKANLAGPTFTGTVTLPSTTSIGNVSSNEIGYVDGLTSTAQTQIDSKIDKLIAFNRQTASYQLVLADAVRIVEMNSASANNLTVPPNSSVAFPIGTQILVAQYGAGQTTFVPGSGVTIRSDSGKLKIAAQYGAATLIKVGTDEWYLVGAITN